MKFYVDKFPKTCGCCPLHRGIERDGCKMHCGILPANDSVVSECGRDGRCPINLISNAPKTEIPKIDTHVLAVKELCAMGMSIETAIYRICKIYDLTATAADLLFLAYYYEARDNINSLIAEYESDLNVQAEVKE